MTIGTRPKRPAPHDSPALDLWWRELAAGLRTKTTIDPLWEAAVEEYRTREWDEDGFPEIAAKCRAEARRIIQREARGAA